MERYLNQVYPTLSKAKCSATIVVSGIIIPETTARTLFKTFSLRGWRKEEPGDPMPQELPRRFERLVMGALADGLISESRANEILGMQVRDFLSKEAVTHGGWLAEVCN